MNQGGDVVHQEQHQYRGTRIPACGMGYFGIATSVSIEADIEASVCVQWAYGPDFANFADAASSSDARSGHYEFSQLRHFCWIPEMRFDVDTTAFGNHEIPYTPLPYLDSTMLPGRYAPGDVSEPGCSASLFGFPMFSY